jgi:prepilin-type N-terminal cleavage/methylation domain-containing protein
LRAFTLIEVLISVLILFISASIFYSIVGNTKKLVNFYTKTKEKTLKSSIILENKNVKNAYEEVIGFNINNDEIIQDLKKDKIKIKIKKTKKYEIIDINNIKYFRLY